MSYHIYPVMRTEPFCDDYIVKVNGEGNLKIKKKQIEEIFDKLTQIYNS